MCARSDVCVYVSDGTDIAGSDRGRLSFSRYTGSGRLFYTPRARTAVGRVTLGRGGRGAVGVAPRRTGPVAVRPGPRQITRSIRLPASQKSRGFSLRVRSSTTHTITKGICVTLNDTVSHAPQPTLCRVCVLGCNQLNVRWCWLACGTSWQPSRPRHLTLLHGRCHPTSSYCTQRSHPRRAAHRPKHTHPIKRVMLHAKACDPPPLMKVVAALPDWPLF